MPHPPERLMQDIVERAAGDAQYASVAFIGPPGKILKIADGGIYLVKGVPEGFAIFKR